MDFNDKLDDITMGELIKEMANMALERLRIEAQPQHKGLLAASEVMIPLIAKDAEHLSATLGFVTMLFAAMPSLHQATDALVHSTRFQSRKMAAEFAAQGGEDTPGPKILTIKVPMAHE
jgi:hypothetical protein